MMKGRISYVGASLIACGLIASASSAFAQGMRFPLADVPVKSLKSSVASAVAPLYASGRIGQWSQIESTPNVKNAPNLVMAWDSMSTSPTTLAAFTQGVYGAHPGPKRINNDSYREYLWVNDANFVPSTLGRFGRYLKLGVYVNPNGGTTGAGTADYIFKISTAAKFDDTGNGPAADHELTGIAARFNGLAAGNHILTIDLASTATSVPIPRQNGALRIEVGKPDGVGQYTKLVFPSSIQPLLSNMLSPGEPLFPGTNTSSSSNWQWDDDGDVAFGFGSPDYVLQDFTNTASEAFPFAEQYDYTDATRGILQCAAAIFVDTNVTTISGQLSFSGLVASATKPSSATFQVKSVATGQVISTQTVGVSSAGAYTIMDPQQGTGGNYVVYVKASHWLQKSFTANTTGGLNVSGRNAVLTNGDCNHDNMVDLFDYLVMSGVYELDSSVPGWDYPAESGVRTADGDLNGDLIVDFFDYLILSSNYELEGDTP